MLGVRHFEGAKSDRTERVRPESFSRPRRTHRGHFRVYLGGVILFSDVHRSDSSSANTDELKRMKSLMSDLQELAWSFVEHMEKFESMESTISDLQSQFSQIESRIDRCSKEIDYVSLKSFSYKTLSILNAASGEKTIELDNGGDGKFQHG